MPVAEVHPSVEELAAFTLGTLDDETQGSIEAHVAACESCQERAAVAPGDDLIELLRSVHARPAALADTVTEAPQAHTPTPRLREAVAAAPPYALPADSDAADDLSAIPPELARHERYRAVRLLGEGGMGSVYEAEQIAMQRRVALKVIRRADTAGPAALERFRREVRAAARLSHPNIVTAYDAETAGELHFLVMEYVEGITLAWLVKERGPLPIDEACAYVRQAALGLQHAHERGLVHRDIKPDNLIRCADGTMKVLDFGLAALTAERGGGLTDMHVIIGTPDYMAPEQAEDSRSADARADVYSLGCTLHFLLSGNVPYPAPTPLLMVLAHRERAVPSLRPARPDVSPELDAVLTRMLAKKPEDRYQTAGEVAVALKPFTQAAAGPSRKHRRLVAIALAALLGGLVLAGGVVYRIETDKGELVITAESDDVEVVIKQGGKVVRIIDTKTAKEVSLALRSGTYELELKSAPEGLTLDIDRATLTRGETRLAKIERVPKPGAPVPGEAAEIINPLHHLRWAGGIGDTNLSPDGRYVVAVRAGRKGIRVWETESGKLVFERNPGWVARFTPDSTQLIMCEQFSDVHVYDLAKGQQVRVFDTHAQMYNIGFPAEGRLLYWTLQGPQVWDWSTGKKLCDVPWTEGDLVLLTADGRHLFQLAGGKAPLRVLDAATGKEVDSYPQLRDIPRLTGLSMEGKHLTNLEGRSVTVYEVATGKEAGKVDLGPGGWCKMGGTGRRVLTGSYRPDELRLLDTKTGRLLGRLRFPEPISLGGADGFISVGGRHASVVTSDGSVYLFRLPDPPPAKKNP